MVTNFEESWYKMNLVKNEVISFLTCWVAEHNEDNYYRYIGKTIMIPIYNDIVGDIDYMKFHGLKVIDGTLFVGVYNNEINEVSWYELDNDNVLTISALWNIVEVLFLIKD